MNTLFLNFRINTCKQYIGYKEHHKMVIDFIEVLRSSNQLFLEMKNKLLQYMFLYKTTIMTTLVILQMS